MHRRSIKTSLGKTSLKHDKLVKESTALNLVLLFRNIGHSNVRIQ